MRTKITETKPGSALGRVRQLVSAGLCLVVVLLTCSSATAQNLFVSGRDAGGGEVFKFTWDGVGSIFASGFYKPRSVAFDGADNLFVVDYEIVHDDGVLRGVAAIYKITPTGMLTIFASGLSYASSVIVDRAGNLFVADYDSGVIYQYKPSGLRATFASGLYHPSGMAFDSFGNLFVADNSIGNIYQGSIYKYEPDGSRVIFAVLDPGDRPSDLAFDNLGNLYMADLSGKIYRYDLNGILRRYSRTTFGSVPNSAQSLAFNQAGNLFVADPGDANAKGSAVYKFTAQGARSTFASVDRVGDTFAWLTFEPISCCQ